MTSSCFFDRLLSGCCKGALFLFFFERRLPAIGKLVFLFFFFFCGGASAFALVLVEG